MKRIYKTIRTLTVLLCFLAAMTGTSQVSSYIGTGTTYNTNTGYPTAYGNYYWFSKHQFFVSPAEMAAANIPAGANILRLGFNVFSTNTQTPLTNFSIVIYTTTLTNPLVAGHVTTGQVATGGPSITYTTLVGWNTHTLTPFTYNGTDGLVVEVCQANLTPYTYNASTYWVTNLTGPEIKSRWIYQDNISVCQAVATNSGTSATTRPNIRLDWLGSPCQTTPAPSSVVVPTFAICPNTSVTISGSTNYTFSALSYTWQASTGSALGPYTTISTGTNNYVATPNLTTSTWFQAIASCTNGGSPTIYAAGQVSVAPVTINNVPYYEGFEGIIVNNQLPNCSWTSTGGNAQTYISTQPNNRIPRTGNKFASVYGYNLTGTNYYYTNGINMFPGITYSASVFYVTEYFGYTNFQELSLLVGPAQSTTGLVNIVTQSVVVSNIYKELQNTFTVPTAGLYYVAIKVVSAANGQFANYLSWDDLSITIPCQLNTPTVAVSATSNTICAGQTVTLTATGATTYSWNTGATTSTIAESPALNTTYFATGTSTLTNCMSTVTKNVIVKPVPFVSIVPSATAVCDGSPVNLVAMGATSYTWGNGNNSAFITVTVSTGANQYTVSGSFANTNNNCAGVATQMIQVNPLPNITALSSFPTSCPGQNVNLSATLSGTGAATFQWLANSLFVPGSPVVVAPMVSTTYTVTGTDNNGCSKSTTVVQTVVNCTGINEHAGTINGLSVYPNPNNGDFTIELNNGLSKTFEIIDVTGRVLLLETTSNDKVNLNINNFANGIYYVKVKTNDAVEVLKIVKQ